jgi:hypothetical protein
VCARCLTEGVARTGSGSLTACRTPDTAPKQTRAHAPNNTQRQPEEEADKKAAFVAELRRMEDWLASHGGPLFGGAALNATDAAVAPKLYHATVALGQFKGWALDANEFPALATYMAALSDMPAWRRTLPADGDAAVVAGWKAHMSG